MATSSSQLAVCRSLTCPRATKLHSELLPWRRPSSFLLSLSHSNASHKQPSAFRGARLRAIKGSREGEKGKQGPAAMAVVVEAIEKQDESRRKGWRRRREVTEEVPEHLLPRVAIVGRPNVGKSALFNRLVGRNIAIVHDEPGVTRDRLYARALWEGRQFLLTDTGGLMDAPTAAAAAAAASAVKGGRGARAGRGSASSTALLALAKADGVAVIGGGGRLASERAAKEAEVAGLPELIGRQAAAAVEEADAIIMVVDGQAGATAADVEIAQWLRRRHVASSKPVFLAVNKCESPTKGLLQTAEFWSLGLTPMAVSALSGTGTGDLLDELLKALPSQEEPESSTSLSTITSSDAAASTQLGRVSLAIVGRPNVGKSSIVNALLGEERTIVSPVSGTTRDAIDTKFTGPDGQEYTLIDTAGVRRKAAVAAGSRAEGLSVNRALRAIRRADVVGLVVDAMLCVTEQDLRLAEQIEREGKACVVIVNKWDTVPDKDATSTVSYTEDVRGKLRSMPWAPLVFTSATTGQRVA
ncbi:unnamed protein product, partial [Closterium sp. Yama58-4]